VRLEYLTLVVENAKSHPFVVGRAWESHITGDECLGENPKGGTEREDQLRWVGIRFSSRASLLLPLCDSVVRVLCVMSLAVCIWVVSRRWLVAVSRVRTAFGSGGRVSLNRRAEGGRIVGQR